MAAPEVHHLFHGPIADHSFSADHGSLAVARDNNVELYSKVGNAYKLKDQLKGHDKTVTSVDIAPNSGRIVSCSQGRLPHAPSPSPATFNVVVLIASDRSQCSRLGTLADWLQAHPSSPAHQPGGHLRPLVTLRDQVRCRFR